LLSALALVDPVARPELLSISNVPVPYLGPLPTQGQLCSGG